MANTSSGLCTLDQISLDHLSDRFSALNKQESAYVSDDYIANINEDECQDGKKVVDVKCRQTMTTWCYKILDFCKASPDTCGAAMSNLDRFLSTERGNFALYDRRWFQLAVMCSLQLAIKIHDSGKLEMGAMLQLGRGSFTADEVLMMEEEILYALAWRICPPTPYIFLELLIELVPSTPTKQCLYNNAKKQIYKAVPQYEFSTVSQSLVACAALLNAMDDIRSLPIEIEGAFISNLATITGISCSDARILTLKMDLRRVNSRSAIKKQTSNRSSMRPAGNIQKLLDSPVSVRQEI